MSAQTPRTVLSSDSVALGEICTLTVFFDSGVREITLLNPTEWVGGVRFRDAREVFSTEERKFQILFSLYETPICTIAPISFAIVNADSTIDTVATDYIVMRVPSIFEGKSEKQLEKIQTYGLPNPMRAGKFPIMQTLLIIAIIIIAILLIALIAKKLLTKKAYEKPPVPPFEEAMQALAELDECNLINNGEYKRFVFTISQILKRFVSRRFEVPIEESTSTEFKQWARKSDLSRENKHLLENFINETDPVKFADITPRPEVLRELRKNVEDFIKITRPIEISEKK